MQRGWDTGQPKGLPLTILEWPRDLRHRLCHSAPALRLLEEGFQPSLALWVSEPWEVLQATLSPTAVTEAANESRCPQQGKPSPGWPSEQPGAFPTCRPCLGARVTGGCPGDGPWGLHLQALLLSQVCGVGPPWSSCDFSTTTAAGSRWPSQE